MALPMPATIVTPGKVSSVSLNSASIIQAIKFSNGSPYDITVSKFGTLPPGTIIPEGTEIFLYADVENQGVIDILPVDNYNIGGTSVVNMVVFYAGEKLPTDRGYWPVTIPVQTVKATVSSVSQLSNEGAAVGTLVIDIGPTPAGLNNIINIWNDHFIWSVVQAGVAHTVLQGQTSGNPLLIGQSGDNSEVMGNLVVDGTVTVTGAVTATNSGNNINASTLKGGANLPAGRLGFSADGDIIDANTATAVYFKARSAGSIIFQTPNGTEQAHIDSTGLVMASGNAVNVSASGKIIFQAGTVTRFTGFSGTGSGTFNTNQGATPSRLAFNPCTVSGSSQTIGGTEAQSSVVTTGAGLAWGGTAWSV